MTTLFKIETDRVSLKWTRVRAEDPPFLHPSSPIPGRLVLTPRRAGLEWVRCWRAGVPTGAAGSPELVEGPRLFEQTDYQIFLESKDGQRVDVRHRDPVLLGSLRHERHGSIVYGLVNFGNQVGRSKFTIVLDGQPEFSFDVEVFPTKLDYVSDYERLLAETQDILMGLALEYMRATYRLGMAARVPQPTDLEWVVLLHHIVDQLERALQQVARRPVRALSRTSIMTRSERIRRLDSTVRSAVRRGAGAGSWQPLDSGTRVRSLIPVRSARPTLDTPEHRWLAAQVDRIRRRLDRLLQTEARRPRSERRDQTLKELRQLESRIVRLARLEPLEAASGPPPAGFASLQLMAAPGYQEAYRACLALALGLRLEGDPLRLSVKDLDRLYEYWCYLALLQIMAEESGQPIRVKDLFRVRQDGLQVALRAGHETQTIFSSADGRQIAIRYNPRFETETLVPQEPDLVVTISDRDWPSLHLVMDAKYRIDASDRYQDRYGSPGPPEDAINVLHRYRDAILESDTDSAGRPKHAVVQAVAAFPYREPEPGTFRESRLWKSLERLGIGAVPLLPGHTDYLREWLRQAMQRGSWALAERAIAHRAHEQMQKWRQAASEPVLIGVLRGDNPAQHLQWIIEERCYYMPLRRTQERQFVARWVAIYSPAPLRHPAPGAVTHVAPVLDVQVVPRRDIHTPWQPHRDLDEPQVVYKLGEVRTLAFPIENIGPDGRGQRLSSHRWTSRLGLERAQVLSELLLETEPEWRLYEELQARGIPFRVVHGPVTLTNGDSPAGRARFLIADNVYVRYAGAAGFVCRDSSMRERLASRIEDVIAFLEAIRTPNRTGDGEPLTHPRANDLQ